MTMPVCDRIEVLSVNVTRPGATDPVKLPLTKDFVVAKFFLGDGHITGAVPQASSIPSAAEKGWWRLDSFVDASILVVFAYELVSDGTGAPNKVPLGSLEEAVFPNSGVDVSDPDFFDPAKTVVPAAGSPGPQKAVQTTVTAVPPPVWIIVAFGLTTCKERSDFEPGSVLNAGRV